MKQQKKGWSIEGTKSQKAIDVSEENYRNLFNHNLAGTYKTNFEGKIVDCNDAFAKMLGYNKEDLLKLKAVDLYFSQSDRSRFIKEIKQSRLLTANTCLLKRRDGTRCWILENTFLDESDFIIGTVIDISERERVEESLLEAEEKYQLLVEMSPTCIAIHVNEKLAFVNEATVKFFKANTREELLGKSIFDLIAPEYHAIVKGNLLTMQAEMKAIPLMEEKFVCLDGSVVSVEVSGVPIYYRGLPAYQVIFQDISERKKMRVELIREELRYKELTELLPQPVFETDLEGNILTTNEFALRQFGLSLEKIEERINLFNYIAPTDLEMAKKYFKQKLEGKTLPQIVYTLRREDGSTFKGVIYASIIYKNDKPSGLRGIILDVTERNSIEEYERKRRDKIIWYQTALLELSKIDKIDFTLALKKVCEIAAQTLGADYVSVWTQIDENFTVVCRNIYDLQNDSHSQGEIVKVREKIGKQVSEIFEEEGVFQYDDITSDPSLEIFKSERLLKRKINSLLYTPVWSQNSIIAVVCHECSHKKEWTLEEINFTKSIADITSIIFLTVERNKATEQIKKSEAYFRAIVEDQTELICRFLPDEILTFVNGAYCRFFNKEKEDLVGSRFTDFVPEEDIQFVQKNLSALNYENPIITYEHRVKLDNNEIRWQQWIVRIILCDAKGESLEFQAVGRDITLQKKLENELIESREKIEESSRLKSIFLENMSHELRTPITGILGLTDLLRDELENEVHRDLADKVINSTNRLMTALNLLITISETESQKPVIKRSGFNLVETTKAIVQQFEKINSEKNLYLKYIVPSKEIKIFLDKSIFKLIIECLVDNAYKFTKKGGITVDIKKISVNEKKLCSIKITDTGIGIAKENHLIVFKEFKQLSEGFSRQFEGFGLGLTVAKRLTEMMDGKIEIESELGKGTSISVLFEI